MSAVIQDCCGCETPQIINVPGTSGAVGPSGSNGTNGISSFTTTTIAIDVPAAPGVVISPAVVTFGSTAWMSVGMVIFISDGVDFAHFKVLTLPSATSATLEWLGYDGDAAAGSNIATAATVSASGTQPAGPFSIATGGTGSTTATLARAALGVGGASLSVYAAGTAYQLTATPALIDFGTTDPSLVITSPGVWLILARARVDYTGATFAAVRTGALKLRRTNNTAADIANSANGFLTEIVTTLTYTLDVLDFPPIIYTTTNSDDILQLWGSISVVPTAGSLDVSEASLVAIKLFDQTV